MLLFAMFTLGYFFGVVITLKVFGQKDKVEGYQPVENALNSDTDRGLSSWELYDKLTKPNYPNNKAVEVSGKVTASQALQ